MLSFSVVVQVARAAAHRRRGRPDRTTSASCWPASPSSAPLSCTGLFFVADGRYLLGAGLFVLANISFGAATVVYYSWLPDLAGPDERDAVSSRGWAVGYVGGALLLAVHLGLFLSAESLGPDRGRGGADLPGHRRPVVGRVHRLHRLPAAQPAGRGRPAGRDRASGFRQLATTLREMRAFPLTLWFLGAYLLFNDGVQTVISLSAVYATEELDLEQSVLTGAILMVQVVAIAGALGLGRVAARYGATRTVLGCLVAWTGGAGGRVLPADRARSRSSTRWPRSSAWCRAARRRCPGRCSATSSRPGKEAEYYGFYEISDRGTSWLGPLAFGLTYQLTGSYRLAIISLVVFFVAGFVAAGPAADAPRRPRRRQHPAGAL